MQLAFASLIADLKATRVLIATMDLIHSQNRPHAEVISPR
jgi:hypothetical protein